jgi:hypothetical protein
MHLIIGTEKASYPDTLVSLTTLHATSSPNIKQTSTQTGVFYRQTRRKGVHWIQTGQDRSHRQVLMNITLSGDSLQAELQSDF